MYIDDATRLRHMLDSASEALHFAAGRTRADLDSDRMLALALMKDVEIIGEAANRVSLQFRDTHPQIPWRDAIDMRNLFVHIYFAIDLDILWSTVVNDLPPLLTELQKLVPDSH
jgi:uncharacterized protein with HEPN domain